jgi:hypothetical protein
VHSTTPSVVRHVQPAPEARGAPNAGSTASTTRMVPVEATLPTFVTLSWKALRRPARMAPGAWLLSSARSTRCSVAAAVASLSARRVAGSPAVAATTLVSQVAGASGPTMVRSLSGGAASPAGTEAVRVQTTCVPAPGEAQLQPAVVEPAGQKRTLDASGTVTSVGATVAFVPVFVTSTETSRCSRPAGRSTGSPRWRGRCG